MRYMSLPKLRECLGDAEAFAFAGGSKGLVTALREAVRIAETHEPEDSFKACLLCGRRHQRDSRYCCYDCAEEDGAIVK